jgi:subtilisin family serine protease
MIGMRRLSHTIGIILCLLIFDSSAFSQAPGLITTDRTLLRNRDSAGRKPEYVPNQLLIKFKTSKTNKGAGEQSQSATPSDAYSLLLKKHKVREVTKLFRETASMALNLAMRPAPDGELSSSFLKSFQDRGLVNVYRVNLEPGIDVMVALEDFRKLPEVEYAEPNYIYRTQALLNDPYLASQGSWGQPYQDLWGLYKISAPEAWDIATGASVLVAVVDTGCDINHPDLTGNIWRNLGEIPDNGIDDDSNGFVDDATGWNFVDQNNDVADNYGHGTHVSGTIAAIGNNGLGVVGVARGARVMAVKGLNDHGYGDLAGLSSSILYAVESGAQVINMSWGGSEFSNVVEDTLSLAASQNVTLVAAAGNSSSWAYRFYPANSRHVITVGASDHTDNRSDFSNFGDSLDVLAPGGDSADDSPALIFENILSLRSSTLNGEIAESTLSVAPDYLRLRGTSMATPHVAGLAALILERFPSATPEEIRQVIRRSADWIPEAFEKNGWGGTLGYGRINALKAMSTTVLGSARILAPDPEAKNTAEFVPLKITASCPGFDRWELNYYNEEMHPLALHSSTSPRLNYQLPDWNTESIPDGSYLLRLRVVNQQGDEFFDQMKVEFDRVNIASPAMNSAFRPGQVITFTGMASGGAFTNYIIQYRDSTSEEWRSDGITLTDGGTRKVRDGILGTWDTSDVHQPAVFIVRLAVKRSGLYEVTEETQLIIDPTLHLGWPQNVGFNGWGYLKHLIAADIDKDGQMEIPVGFGDEVKVFRSDGTMAAGWPQKINQRYGDLMIEDSPLVADIDSDGNMEIVASAWQSILFVWDYRGNLRPGFPKWDCDVQAVSDFDGDGKMEIFCTSMMGYRFLSSDGEEVGFKSLQPSDFGGNAVGDLDGDGKSEAVALFEKENSTWIDIIDSHGTSRPGWPKQVSTSIADQFVILTPVLVDLDGDGKLEIVCPDDNRVLAVRLDGSNVQGWPVPTSAGAWFSGLAAADVTGDGSPEIFVRLVDVVKHEESFLLLDSEGSPIPGWPIKGDAPYGTSGAAAIVDLDGDGYRELIFGTGPPVGSVYPSLHALRANGQELPGFPKYSSNFDAGFGNTPVVADLDGDRFLEIAWLNQSGDIYVWDTSTIAQIDGSDWPMSQHDPQHTGALAHPVRASLTMHAGAMASTSTYGSAGMVQVGYARGSVKSGSAPYGTAVFSYVRDNIVVSETAVPVSPPTQRSRIFVDHRVDVAAMPGHESAGFIDVQTGLAVVNCGSATANITYILRNATGSVLTIGTGNLARGAHFAKFVDQLAEVAQGFVFPESFSTAMQFGSLDIVSDQPLSVVALRLTFNQRNDPIMTTTPIADLTIPTNNNLIYFPQLADGGGYLSSLVLINTSGSVESGVLNLYKEDGSSLVVNRLGGASGSQFRYSIPPHGVFVFETDGGPFDINTGSVQLLPDSNTSTPVGSGFFSFMQREIRVTETGVPAVVPTTHVRFFIDMSKGHNTGVALAATSESSLIATVRAFQPDGVTPAGIEKTISLNPSEHRVAFVDELVGVLPKDFIGVLDISSSRPFIALAIRCLINERGDFLISTYPNADLTRAAPTGPLIFPQIAAGDGYKTDFFLLSSGGPSTVVLDFFSDTGSPLAVGK